MTKIFKNSQYFSFCGSFATPSEKVQTFLNGKFPQKMRELYMGTDSNLEEVWDIVPMGVREGLQYEELDSSGALSISLAPIKGQIGHLVVACPEAGWVEEGFVRLIDGRPVKTFGTVNPMTDAL